MDIHSPSIPKIGGSKTADTLNELLEERTILEGSLAQLNAILESHGVGIHHSTRIY